MKFCHCGGEIPSKDELKYIFNPYLEMQIPKIIQYDVLLKKSK
jgi:hypothetical protein